MGAIFSTKIENPQIKSLMETLASATILEKALALALLLPPPLRSAVVVLVA
jgi:hypothetical protein